MSQPTSFCLDVLRVLAALMVFFYHCMLFWYPGQAAGLIGHLGHRSVIVFFVLSGYVIAYATLRRESNFRAYAVARLSRLYSVVLPALVLTAAVTALGAQLNPTFYETMAREHGVVRYLLTAFFLQSVWTLNAAPPTNGPFWSLGYEFWYYALFAAAIFVPTWPRRLAVVTILLFVSGVDSLLLLPSWLMGVALYLGGGWVGIPRLVAFASLILSSVAFFAALFYLPDYPWHYGYPPFFFSSAFITDNVLGLILTAVIGFFDQATRDHSISRSLETPVRAVADHTFSLYLYHFPLVLFAAAAIPFNRQSPMQVGFVVLAVLGLVALLSLITEARRPWWRKVFSGAWDLTFVRTSSRKIAP